MDLKKLSRAEQIICASGIVLFILSFFNWYKVDSDIPGAGDFGISGFDTTLGMFAAIIALVMVGVIAASKFGNVKLPDVGSLTWGQIHLGLGALALLFVVIRLIDVPAAFAYDRSIWLIVATVAAIGLAGGGYLKMQEEKAGGSAPMPPAA